MKKEHPFKYHTFISWSGQERPFFTLIHVICSKGNGRFPQHLPTEAQNKMSG
ncbi:MAG: hypothetical protein GY805_23360 [Chloroflexi bacterium]|nr:hypothetical protein [Chloroflexota bacterium]